MSQSGHDTDHWKNRPASDPHFDWRYGGDSWIEEYKTSVQHPHRQTIVELLREHPWDSLLEVGCSAGPNLKVIRDSFPDKKLYGVDVNAPSVEAAKAFVDAEFAVASFHKLPFEDKSVDIILADAVLMYAKPEEIREVMKELSRVAKHRILIVDRVTPSVLGEDAGGVWGRDYPTLLSELGFHVKERKMEEKDWPDSHNWQRYGAFVSGTRP